MIKKYLDFVKDVMGKLQALLMSDKMQHFVWSYFFVTVLLFFAQMKVMWVVLIALALIVGKEYIIDKFLKRNTPSKKDMVFGAVGVLVGLMVYFFRMA